MCRVVFFGHDVRTFPLIPAHSRIPVYDFALFPVLLWSASASIVLSVLFRCCDLHNALHTSGNSLESSLSCCLREYL